jgi:hypothetical protein
MLKASLWAGEVRLNSPGSTWLKKNLEQTAFRRIIAQFTAFLSQNQSVRTQVVETQKTQNREQFMKRIVLSALLVSALVSAQAATYTYNVNFAPEVGGSSGSGTGTVVYNDVSHSLQMTANFSGLTGTVTQSHFHGPTATPGVGTTGIAVGSPNLPGFPIGATSGSYNQTLDLTQTSSYSSGFLTSSGGTAAGAELAFFNAMNEGKIYWNIHSSFAGGGEIRGFLSLVPEPSSLALFGLGAVIVAARRLKNR